MARRSPSSRHLVLSGSFGWLLRKWDSVQVELLGRYSLPRLAELQLHVQTSSRFRRFVRVVATPLPCLGVVIALNMLPVRSPSLGFFKQTVWVVFRIAFTGWIMSLMIALQVHQSSPTLPLPPQRLLVVAFVATAVTVLAFSLLGIFVAFPTPFVMQLCTGPWFISFTTGLYLSWRDALRRDAIARDNLRRYAIVFGAQVTIFFVYTAHSVAFTTVERKYQTLVAMLLPLLKLVFKNVMNRGLYDMEDLAPTVIVFNVDVFHALFVSSAMQQAQTGGSIMVIMVVDVVQAVIACYEANRVMSRIRRNVATCAAIDRSSSRPTDMTEPQRLQTLGLVGFALHVLDTYPQIRTHPSVSQARHLRARSRRSLAVVSAKALVAQVAGQAVGGPPDPAAKPPDPLQRLPSSEQLRLRIVEDVLKLLHMVEFYVLIEFVEVVVAAVYTLNFLALSKLPIRAYYGPLATLSPADMDSDIVQVALYTMLELLSFVVFCLVLRFTLACRVPTISQLSFVLEKHVRMAQTTLVMWVFFVTQLSLEHLGSDYTFKFKWLHERPGTA